MTRTNASTRVKIPGAAFTTYALVAWEKSELFESSHLYWLPAIVDKDKNKRKRSLNLESGDQLDLMPSSLVTPQVLEALRARIIELEDGIALPSQRARNNDAKKSPRYRCQ
ncbi:hypothetical protein E4T56_gene1402 [Termitomyces sp. T112]|nr:hypothetical protein E4T56_gene1402 [Termitomyces sp. T112]